MTVPPDIVPPMRSPDGSVEVRFSSLDVRMSVWVNEPLVFRTRDGALVVSFDGTLLDSSDGTTFPAPNRVRLALRKYPNGAAVRYVVVVDVEAETFGLGEGADPDRPLSALPRAIPGVRV